jgi:hypothetical protein
MIRRVSALLVLTGVFAVGSVTAAGADPPTGCPPGFRGPVPINQVPQPTVGWSTNAPVEVPPLVCVRHQDTGNGPLSIVVPFS